jgi:hypothetical protein
MIARTLRSIFATRRLCAVGRMHPCRLSPALELVRSLLGFMAIVGQFAWGISVCPSRAQTLDSTEEKGCRDVLPPTTCRRGGHGIVAGGSRARPSRFESSKGGAIMTGEILPWPRRHAMMLASQLPDGTADAVIILRLVTELAKGIFGRP